MGALIEAEGNGESHAEKICTSNPVVYQLVRVIIVILCLTFQCNLGLTELGLHSFISILNLFLLFIIMELKFFPVSSSTIVLPEYVTI